MTINATASTLLALYVAVADERGVPRNALHGTIQNDILKEYIARGTYIYPPRPSLRLIVDTFAWCKAEVPKWNTISISGYHIREAGSDAVQEVAFTLADGIAYVEAAHQGRARRRRVRRAALASSSTRTTTLLEEVAKFRAARRLWAHDHARALRRQGSEVVAAALSRADGRLDAAGAAAAGQRRADHGAGARGGARRRAVAAHQRASTRRWRCRRRPRRGWRCARSRSSRTSRGIGDIVDPLGGAYARRGAHREIEKRADELHRAHRRDGRHGRGHRAG